MTAYQSDFLKTLTARGLLQDGAGLDELDQRLKTPGQRAYIGFDCTADGLHVGSLLPLMLLRHFHHAGHQPMVLFGGGTTKVGDPSGKDTARQLLDDATIQTNKAGIMRVIHRLVPGLTPETIVDNADWLGGLGYIDFLRDIGPHFSINRMLTFDSVRLRVEREQTLSFLEFNYMLLQSYDFWHLFKTKNCILQMGGSDQWGNMISGVDLIRRLEGQTAHALTVPLLTTASGAKMGKTADGAVWLSADKTSPYDFWQYWRNVEDADVAKFLRFFTTISLGEIEDLTKTTGSALNAAKIRLATEVTTLCHGADVALSAAETAKKTFSGGGLGGDIPTLTLTGTVSVMDVLLDSGFCTTRGEAKRLLEQGGVKINGHTVTAITATLSPTPDSAALQVGKKKHARLVWDGM
ncbi:MAG: tyrosine--tRNA ligase [Alphaproteobacteria bacterium]